MPIKIMTTKSTFNRAYIKVYCPICETSMKIDKEVSPVVCKYCGYIYPDIFILIKTTPPIMLLEDGHDTKKLNRWQLNSLYNTNLKKSKEIISFHCDDFDFFPIN